MPKKTKKRKEVTYKDMVFVDRVGPRNRFWETADSLLKITEEDPEQIDLMQYYGVGGIGKTQLLYQLLKEIKEKNLSKYNNRIKPIYVHIPQFLSKVDGNLELPGFLYYLSRLIMASCNMPDSFLFFDYALAQYIQQRDKNFNEEYVKEYIEDLGKKFFGTSDNSDRETVLGLMGLTVGVLGDFLPIASNTIAAVINIAAKVTEKIKKAFENDKDAEAKCKKIDDALRNSVDDDVALAKVLITEFLEAYEAIAENLDGIFVIMLDEYESLVNIHKDGTVARDKDASIRKLINESQKILWVIAGREKLEDQDNWTDKYEFDDVNQINVSELGKGEDEEDKKAINTYFEEMGVEEPEVRDLIANLTKGTPIHLWFCYKIYEELKANNGDDYIPSEKDFGSSTEGLAIRYLDTMSEVNRSASEVLSAIPTYFTREMAMYVAEKVNRNDTIGTPFNALAKMSIMEQNGESYKLHDTFRRAVRDNMNRSDREACVKAIMDYYLDIIDNTTIVNNKLGAYRGLLGYALEEEPKFVGEEYWERLITSNSRIMNRASRNIEKRENCWLIRDKLRKQGWKDIIDEIDSSFSRISTSENDIKKVIAYREEDFGSVDYIDLGLKLNLVDNIMFGECYKTAEGKEEVENVLREIEEELLLLAESSVTEKTLRATKRYASRRVQCYREGGLDHALEIIDNVYSNAVNQNGELSGTGIGVMFIKASLLQEEREYVDAIAQYEIILELLQKAKKENDADYSNMFLGGPYSFDEDTVNLRIARCKEGLNDNEVNHDDNPMLEYRKKKYENSLSEHGPRNPQTLYEMESLAKAYEKASMIEDALLLSEELYEAYKEEGPLSQTVFVAKRLDELYRSQGEISGLQRIDEDIDYYLEVLRDPANKRHLFALSDLIKMIFPYRKGKRDAFVDTLIAIESYLNDGAEETVYENWERSGEPLASAYIELGLFDEAVRIQQKIIESSICLRGDAYWGVYDNKSRRANVLMLIEREDEAIKELEECYDYYLSGQGDDGSDTKMVLGDLYIAKLLQSLKGINLYASDEELNEAWCERGRGLVWRLKRKKLWDKAIAAVHRGMDAAEALGDLKKKEIFENELAEIEKEMKEAE